MLKLFNYHSQKITQIRSFILAKLLSIQFRNNSQITNNIFTKAAVWYISWNIWCFSTFDNNFLYATAIVKQTVRKKTLRTSIYDVELFKLQHDCNNLYWHVVSSDKNFVLLILSEEKSRKRFLLLFCLNILFLDYSLVSSCLNFYRLVKHRFK